MIGKDGYLEATSSSWELFWRCCHSGERRPGSRRRKQQRPRRALAEAGGEQRRAPDLGGHDLLDLVGLERDQVGARRILVGLGDAQHDAVVGGHRLGVHAVALAQPGVDRQCPGCVDRYAVGRVHDDPPVAELVAEPLDHQPGVARHRVGRLALLLDEGDQVVGGPGVEAGAGRTGECVGPGHRGDLAGEGADGRPQLGGTAEAVALPERQPPRLSGCGGDQHPFVGDVLDPPARRAEGEHVADARLVDHLLVELADASSAGRACRGPDEEHPEHAAVGDRCRRW
jgi:hypothetical protein